jgi:phenylacetate-CoA ligase
MNKPDISIVAPCFNEQGNIFALYDRVCLGLKDLSFELIFVNDGSTDATPIQASEIALKDSRVKLVTHTQNLGIHKSWISGIAEATSNVVCFIDADLQNPPEAIPNMYRVFQDQQPDLVQGTRSSIGRIKDQRMLFSRSLNALLNFTFRQKSQDSKSGFLLGNKTALMNTLTVSRKFNYFQTFLGVSARSKGYRVLEVETLFQSRNVGESFLAGYKAYKVMFGVLADFYHAKKEFRNTSPQERYIHITSRKLVGRTLFSTIKFEVFFLTMGFHKWIISKSAKKYYLWLKETEFKSRNELEKIQLARLQSLLLHTYTHVPYYRQIFDQNGIKPSQVISLADIAKFPMLSKDDVRKNIHFSMFASNHKKKEMHKINTSGSTGEPFVCYADKFQLEVRFATTLRALEMTGWRFGDKQIRLWHQTLGMNKTQVAKEKIDAWFMKRKFIPAFEMTQENVNWLLLKMNKFKPQLVDGYAESLNFLAESANINLSWKPKAIMSSAQELTDDTRLKIENLFQTKVYDKYGSREFSGIAYQCEFSENHHVQDESYLVELLVEGRTARPGEVGEIVITDLNNYSTPMIRYRIGDLAVAVDQKECPCGRNHSLIGKITGRTQALVACSNGVWLPGTFFAHFFKDFDYAIKHYQVFQEEFGSFEIRVVPNPQFSSQVSEVIVHELQKYAGNMTTIRFKIVESIPLVKTGKRTPVISLLRKDFQTITNSMIETRKVH